MNLADSGERISQLLGAGPAGLGSWLAAIQAGRAEVPDGFNWLGLAWGAAHRARTDLSLDWARTAVAIYEYLAALADEREREALMQSSMLLRSFFIERFAPNADDEVLRLEDVVAWFRKGLTVSYHQAAQLAAHWDQLPIEEIRALRNIKNRLAAFVELEPSPWLDPYPDIKDWLALRDQLP